MPAPSEFDRRTPPHPISDERDTGTAETDENYDLVSVLYHCLKAADACTQYIVDAEDAGDDELAEFFERARLQHNQLAGEARALLAERVSGHGQPNEDEE
ncbi:MAG TPA: hypothetical protein VHV51_16975 [Polyangiaceae bacterium]|jgi:hypothetical protein|nr:hypothetical protein [Polyangiaceae bacterium]